MMPKCVTETIQNGSMCNEMTVSTARGEEEQGGREDVEGKDSDEDEVEAFIGDDAGERDHYERHDHPGGAQQRGMSDLKENGASKSEKGHAQNRVSSAERPGESTEKQGVIAEEREESSERHGDTAEKHGEIAEKHGEIAEGHGERAEEHGEIAEEHGEIAEELGERAEEHADRVEEHADRAEERGESAEGRNGRFDVNQNHINGLEVEGRSEAGPSHRDAEVDPYGEIAILVVANQEEDKGNLVSNMKQGDPVSWTVEPLVGKVRTHSRRQYPFRKIIEPTPLQHIRTRSSAAVARRWISENSLRRIISNKCVIGVFVITTEILKETCTSSITNYDSCWVDLLKILFGEQIEGVFFVVNHHGILDKAARKKLENFIRRHDFNPKNLVYPESGDEVMTILEHNLAATANASRTAAPPSFKIQPFYLHEKWNPAKKQSFFKPEKQAVWGSEGVILFGQTGKGKSTLAQMLTTGKLDLSAKKFSYSSGKRGHTKGVETGEGRGWYVVDSPGFGEPKSGGTVPSEQAEQMFKKFLHQINGTYAHYLYVTMGRDRIDTLDEKLWKFFNDDLFGRELCAQFSVVISNADEEWIQSNKKTLNKSFKGCKSFIPAYFPTMEEEFDAEILAEDPNAQEEYRKETERFVRDQQLKSLQDFEERLAILRRADRTCEYGKGSKISRTMDRDRADQDMRVERSLVRRMINQAPRLLFGLDECFSGLVQRLTFSKRVKLVPMSLEDGS